MDTLAKECAAHLSPRDKREIQFLLRVPAYADCFLPPDRQFVRDRLQLFLVVCTNGWPTALAHDHSLSPAHLGIFVQPVRSTYEKKGNPRSPNKGTANKNKNKGHNNKKKDERRRRR